MLADGGLIIITLIVNDFWDWGHDNGRGNIYAVPDVAFLRSCTNADWEVADLSVYLSRRFFLFV